MKKHLEIKTIEHKGIKVIVEINYDLGQVSLVEPIMNQFQDKRWIFAKRSLDYMNGWLNIIDAMKFAITEAKKDLEHDLAEKSKFTEQKITKNKK